MSWLADGEREFPLAIREAVSSNSDRLREIIEKYESCALRVDHTIVDFISAACHSICMLTAEYELLISRSIVTCANNNVPISTNVVRLHCTNFSNRQK